MPSMRPARLHQDELDQYRPADTLPRQRPWPPLHLALRWLAVASAAAIAAGDPVPRDEKESTRVVDASTLPNGVEGWRSQKACSSRTSEAACGLLNGCSWCIPKEAAPPAGNHRRGGPAGRALLDNSQPASSEVVSVSLEGAGARGCVPWTQCAGPDSLCEMRTSEAACIGSDVLEKSCLWCKSETRCVSMSAKEFEADKNGQCKGCDGVYDSGVQCAPGAAGENGGSRFAFTRQEKVGIILALSGNVLISVSLNTQKYAHNANEARGTAKVSYLRLKLWWIGMGLMALGETGNFLAYAYAPATVVAPLGAVSVISNCFLARFVLGEQIGLRNLLGVCLAIVGSVIIVLYAPSSNQQLTMQLLEQYMTETSFIVMVAVIVGVVLALFSLRDAVKKRYVVIYTLICSLTGALTVMCIKGVSTALVLTLQGDNQFYNFLPWVLVMTVVVTLMIQLKYLNLAMMHFGASEVVPVYYVLFTFCSIMAGVLLYKEYHQHCPPDAPDCHYTLFFLGGCFVTFFGVHLINSDRKMASKGLATYRDELDDDAAAVLDGVEIETEGLLSAPADVQRDVAVKSRSGKNSPTAPDGVEMRPISPS